MLWSRFDSRIRSPDWEADSKIKGDTIWNILLQVNGDSPYVGIGQESDLQDIVGDSH